ncbi:MAG: DUF1049 domain-containing protein [Gammaproteobacteria bacterium AqS3]|nr:DUF1049 domain-containing protein [Gammaproteobacteria bacterium AqS3]
MRFINSLINILVGLATVAIVFVLVSNNSDRVALDLLFWRGQPTLGAVLVMAFVVGVVLGLFVNMLRRK